MHNRKWFAFITAVAILGLLTLAMPVLAQNGAPEPTNDETTIYLPLINHDGVASVQANEPPPTDEEADAEADAPVDQQAEEATGEQVAEIDAAPPPIEPMLTEEVEVEQQAAGGDALLDFLSTLPDELSNMQPGAGLPAEAVTVSDESRRRDIGVGGDEPQAANAPQNVDAIPPYDVSGNWTLSGRLGVGKRQPEYDIDVRRQSNSLKRIQIRNYHAGNASSAALIAATTGGAFEIVKHGSGHSGSWDGQPLARWTMLRANSYARGIILTTGGPSDLIFGTNDKEHMRISSDGNVGIGRGPNNYYKLDIDGGLIVRRDDTHPSISVSNQTGGAIYASATQDYGIYAETQYGRGVYAVAYRSGGIGVEGVHHADTGSAPAVYGRTNSGSVDAVGVLGEVIPSIVGNPTMAVRGINHDTTSAGYGGYFSHDGSGIGVYATTAGPTGRAVYGHADNSTGGSMAGYFYNRSSDGIGIYVHGNGAGPNEPALRVYSAQTNGGMATSMTNNSQSATAYFSNGSTGPVLRLTNGGAAGNPGGSGGGNFIEAWNELESDIQFRVTTTGQARSDVGFTTPAQDFAEMMPAARGVTPGDVLAIGFGGKLVRSNHAFQDTVLGVYSTQPGFLGGQAVEGDVEGTVPLALVGIVPVKVTAENGPIFAGDMLVASNTAGRAMNAGSDAPQGTVIGKALETLGGEQGVIQMLVLLQ